MSIRQVKLQVGEDGQQDPSSGSPGEERAQDVFLSIEKALRMRRLYESASKPFQESLDAVTAAMTSFLEEFEDLDVEVTMESFLTGKVAHMKGSHSDASIPFRLYRDGVRSLRFHRGLARDEIGRFLSVLECQPKGEEKFDDDLATILWRENFRSIEFVAVDEIAAPQAGGGGSGGSGGSGGTGSGDGMGGGGIGGGGGGSGGGSGPSDVASQLPGKIEEMIEAIKTPYDTHGPEKKSEGGIAVSAGNLELFEKERLGRPSAATEVQEDLVDVGDAAIEGLRREVNVAEGISLHQRVIEIVVDMFCQGECTLPPEDLQVLLGQFLREMLARGDVAGLCGALDEIVQRPAFQAEPAGKKNFDGILQFLGTQDSLRFLLAAARTGGPRDPKPFENLLGRLPASALQHCARHLRSLESGPVKDAYHRVLQGRGQEDLQALVAYLEEGGEKVDEILRAMLESRKVPGIGKVLENLLSHQDERVRAVALRVCGSLAGPVRRSFIEKGLSDGSAKVRFLAFKAVEASKDLALIPILCRRFEEYDGADDERIRVIHAVAILGGKDAAEFLRGVFMPRGSWWLFRGHQDRKVHWRRAAIISLKDVSDEAVRNLLAEGSVSRDPGLAEACRIALAKGTSPSGGRP